MRVVIIGAGILGLAAAREALRALPEPELIVLDKEGEVAVHQTGHNSGVVHAGLYYKPGSLKARLCRRGAGLMRDYCAQRGLPYLECGKVLVATDQRELTRLDGILERAEANGVPGVRLLSERELHELEPHVAGLGGLHSPVTAVADFAAVARRLRDEIAELGAEVRLRAAVTAVRETGRGAEVELGRGQTIAADRVLVCAGLHVDRLARASGRPADPRIIPFRGEYWALRPERASLVQSLIYPVPDPALPFLGVHLTRTAHGGVLVGPNAVLALAREGYQRRTVNARDVADIAAWPGMRRIARRHWRTGIAELARSASRTMFVHAARRYVPELRPADVVPAQAGVRAQAIDAAGALLDDFALNRGRTTVWVRNAPSPAATSSLAIAEELVELLRSPSESRTVSAR